MSIAEAFTSLCLAFQQPTQSNNDYFNDFKSSVEVLETYGGSGALGFLPEMIKVELEDICTAADTTVAIATDKQKLKATETSCAKFLSALMLSGADQTCFCTMRDDLVNDFAKGDDSYPPTMHQGLLPLHWHCERPFAS